MDWLPHGLYTLQLLDILGQAAPTPPSPTSDEVEMLKQQIEFLNTANASLEGTFQRYVNMVQLTLATAGGIVGIVAILGTIVSIKSLADFYSTLRKVDGKVREAVDQEVAVALKRDRQRLNRLEAILAREDVPDRITIDYLVPAVEPPKRRESLNVLLEILYHRGFSAELHYRPAFQDPELAKRQPIQQADIVILDLYHAGIDQDLGKANAVIRAVGAKIPPKQTALIVYGTARAYDAIPEFAKEDKYCGASNGPLTFVARVLEAAYLVDAVKAIR